jgi:5'-3' exonuclease
MSVDSKLKGKVKSFFTRKYEQEKAGVHTLPPVLILDMMAIFKSHFFANETTTEHGMLVGGVTGVLKNITSLISLFKANKIICVFDGENNTERRRAIYEDYKKGRGNKKHTIRYITLSEEEVAQNEHRQIRTLVEILKGLPVEIVVASGLEADDVIGYLAKKYYRDTNGVRVIVSSDKDMLQLVDAHTQFYNIRKRELVGLHNISDYWDVPVDNFVIVRAIEGDASDNITGVKGIKIKTLLKILPEIQTTKFVGIDDFWSYIGSKAEHLATSKAGQVLLESEQIVRRNFKIMQLSDPDIPAYSEMTILELLRAPKPTSVDFYRVEKFIHENHLSDVINVDGLRSLFGRLNA